MQVETWATRTSAAGCEIPTPHIDRLAGNGIRFTQFYNTSRCCPTRASLLTGLYQHQTGVGHMTTEGPNDFDYGSDGYRGHINRNCVTLADVLSKTGYHTYLSGKWHLGHDLDDRPLQRGFERYYGSLSGAFGYFKPHGDRRLMEGNEPLPDPDPETYYTTDAFADRAVQWIKEQEDEDPFFLYLAFNAPHWPLHAKPEDIERFAGRSRKGWDRLREERFARQVGMGLFDASLGISPRDSEVRPWDQVDEDQKAESEYRMEVYAAQVHSIDENIGKLLRVIEEKEQLDDTLILFLSDNGACAEPYSEFGGGAVSDINNPDNAGAVVGRGWANLSKTPFREYKNRPQEGGIATPLVAHWPAGIDRKLNGGFLRDPAHIIDVMPTIIELSGAIYPSVVNRELIHPQEGHSLTPFFAHGNREPAEFLFFEHENNCAVRSGDWKAISRYGEYDWELYDLARDRNELRDVAGQHPEIVARLDRAWKNWALRTKATPKGNPKAKAILEIDRQGDDPTPPCPEQSPIQVHFIHPTMTSRERVLAAIEYRTPDRPPLNYYGTSETTAKLLAHLKLETHEDLLCALGADMRYVVPRMSAHRHLPAHRAMQPEGTDMWGIEWEPMANDTCTYFEVTRHPLAEARTVRDIEEYRLAGSGLDVGRGIRRISGAESRRTACHRIAHGQFLRAMPGILRGLEQFLMDLVEAPPLATAILKKVTGFFRTVNRRSLEAADGGIDIVWSASDVGMQTGMLISPDIWRETVRPWHREFVTPYKAMGLKSRYHTDGAVTPIIEDLIEMGVDLLDPIQPKATGMTAENLAALFGGRIAFYGGVDTQELLPFGTPEAVEADVLRLIRVLGTFGRLYGRRLQRRATGRPHREHPRPLPNRPGIPVHLTHR